MMVEPSDLVAVDAVVFVESVSSFVVRDPSSLHSVLVGVELEDFFRIQDEEQEAFGLELVGLLVYLCWQPASA